MISKRIAGWALALLLLQPFGQAWAEQTDGGTDGAADAGAATAGAAAEAAAGTPTGTASSLSYETPFPATALTGAYASAQQYFQVPDYWKVEGAKLQLDYKASPTAAGSQSNLTLYVNGEPFYSFKPDTSGTDQHIAADMPLGLLKKGANALTIGGTIRSAATGELQICQATDSSADWLQLSDTTGVHIRYAAAPLDGTIRDFNARFVGFDAIAATKNALVVPDGAEASELEASLYALSGFARASGDKETPIPLLADGRDDTSGKQALVYVALYDRLPQALKSALGAPGDLKDKALIRLVSPDKQPTLVVTSQSAELLIKAGRYVANQTLMQQASSGVKIVDATTDVDSPPTDIDQVVNLTDTGDKLTGPKHREKSYFISLPGNRSIADASKIKLEFSYASNLDFDRSMLTVYANDTPIGSKKLTAEMADGDSINLTIPKNLDISGNFMIKAAFDLEMKGNYCQPDSDQMPWAFISKDSLLQINTKDRADMLFNNYPYPFLRDGSYNRVAVVLPKTMDSGTYRSLSNLFSLLGQSATTNTGDIAVFGDDASADQLKDRQIIAVGTYKNNKVIRDSNGKLYFRYASDGSGFLSNEKMSIDADYGRRVGTVQLIDSPYGAGHGLLAVTGSESEYVYLASKLLSKPSLLYQVYGDGAIADKDGVVHPFRFKKTADAARPTVISEALDREDVVTFMIVVLLTLFTVAVSLLLMIRKHRQRKKRRRAS